MTRLLLLVLLFCAACGNSVDPFEEGGPPFAVFGYLDTARDTQSVRIEPVRPLVAFDTARISVTLRDETAGTAEVMRADIVMLDDGSQGLLYRSTLPVEHAHTYALSVSATDAGTTTARATVPALRRAAIGFVSGDTVLMLSNGARAPERTTLVYSVAAAGDTIAIPVMYAVGNNLADAHFYRLQLRRDRNVLLNVLSLSPGDSIDVVGVSAHVLENGPEWSSREGHNIENGFGFFSTVSSSMLEVVLPDSIRRRIEFGP